MRQPSIIRYGVLLILGILLQVTTSIIWILLATDSGWNEYVYVNGQSLGELCYLLCIAGLFRIAIWYKLLQRNYSYVLVFFYISRYAVNLALMDCFENLIGREFILSIPKFTNFVIATSILVYEIKTNKFKKWIIT